MYVNIILLSLTGLQMCKDCQFITITNIYHIIFNIFPNKTRKKKSCIIQDFFSSFMYFIQIIGCTLNTGMDNKIMYNLRLIKLPQCRLKL